MHIGNYIIENYDTDVVKEEYPFIVKISSHKTLATEEYEYLRTLRDDYIVVTKYREGPAVNMGPIVMVYGFRYENDAVAFKLKFSGT